MAKRKSSSKASATSPAEHQAIADEAVEKIGAALTDEQVESMEAGAASNEVGQCRRLALIVCARPCLELRQISLDEPDVFGQMFDAVEQFRNHTKALSEVAEAAFTRMLVAFQDAETGKTLPIGG